MVFPGYFFLWKQRKYRREEIDTDRQANEEYRKMEKKNVFFVVYFLCKAIFSD